MPRRARPRLLYLAPSRTFGSLKSSPGTAIIGQPFASRLNLCSQSGSFDAGVNGRSSLLCLSPASHCTADQRERNQRRHQRSPPSTHAQSPLERYTLEIAEQNSNTDYLLPGRRTIVRLQCASCAPVRHLNGRHNRSLPDRLAPVSEIHPWEALVRTSLLPVITQKRPRLPGGALSVVEARSTNTKPYRRVINEQQQGSASWQALICGHIGGERP
jgi:hypothetical protein